MLLEPPKAHRLCPFCFEFGSGGFRLLTWPKQQISTLCSLEYCLSDVRVVKSEAKESVTTKITIPKKLKHHGALRYLYKYTATGNRIILQRMKNERL